MHEDWAICFSEELCECEGFCGGKLGFCYGDLGVGEAEFFAEGCFVEPKFVHLGLGPGVHDDLASKHCEVAELLLGGLIGENEAPIVFVVCEGVFDL